MRFLPGLQDDDDDDEGGDEEDEDDEEEEEEEEEEEPGTEALLAKEPLSEDEEDYSVSAWPDGERGVGTGRPRHRSVAAAGSGPLPPSTGSGCGCVHSSRADRHLCSPEPQAEDDAEEDILESDEDDEDDDEEGAGSKGSKRKRGGGGDEEAEEEGKRVQEAGGGGIEGRPMGAEGVPGGSWPAAGCGYGCSEIARDAHDLVPVETGLGQRWESGVERCELR